MSDMLSLRGLSLIALTLAMGAGTALAQQPAPAPRPAPAAAPAPAPSAPGAPIPSVTIAVVDMQQVMTTAAAPKSLREQLDRQRQTFQGELSKRENDLRTIEQDLAKQRATLTADQLNDKRRQFETQVADAQKQANARRQQLQQAEQENLRPIDQAIGEILKQLAAEKNLGLILYKQSTVLSANALDITGDVVSRLDRKVPKAAFKMPALKTN